MLQILSCFPSAEGNGTGLLIRKIPSSFYWTPSNGFLASNVSLFMAIGGLFPFRPAFQCQLNQP
jgi:hypothetical protein